MKPVGAQAYTVGPQALFLSKERASTPLHIEKAAGIAEVSLAEEAVLGRS